MNVLPKKLRMQLGDDPYYGHCARNGLHGHECAGGVTWEQVIFLEGKQINKKWCIVPLCAKARNTGEWEDTGDLSREMNAWIALNCAEQEEVLEVSRVTDYFLYRHYLNRKYGQYIIPKAESSVIAY